MGLELKTVTGQCDVNEGLVVEEVFKDAEEVVLVVVPPETILLRLHLTGGHDGKSVEATYERKKRGKDGSGP